MKNFKWSFIAIALIAICSAFATKSHHNTLDLRYGVLDDQTSTNSYYVVDPDAVGSLDYSCESPSQVCTILVDESITPDEIAPGTFVIHLSDNPEPDGDGTFDRN